MTTKERVLQALADMPEDAAIEDFMERLYLLYKVERGVSQADAGQKVSQQEAREQMAKWLR
jgi:predicted transcriptional regulator